jgi:hypothetical protein
MHVVCPDVEEQSELKIVQEALLSLFKLDVKGMFCSQSLYYIMRPNKQYIFSHPSNCQLEQQAAWEMTHNVILHTAMQYAKHQHTHACTKMAKFTTMGQAKMRN